MSGWKPDSTGWKPVPPGPGGCACGRGLSFANPRAPTKTWRASCEGNAHLPAEIPHNIKSFSAGQVRHLMSATVRSANGISRLLVEQASSLWFRASCPKLGRRVSLQRALAFAGGPCRHRVWLEARLNRLEAGSTRARRKLLQSALTLTYGPHRHRVWLEAGSTRAKRGLLQSAFTFTCGSRRSRVWREAGSTRARFVSLQRAVARPRIRGAAARRRRFRAAGFRGCRAR